MEYPLAVIAPQLVVVIAPNTVNASLVGETAPIDIFPDDEISTTLVLFVAKFKVFAALKYIPFVGTVDPVGMNAVAVDVLDIELLVPFNAPVSVPPVKGR